MPEINVARYEASSCCHGGYIYLFGGMSHREEGKNYGTVKEMKRINKIERLNLSCIRDQTGQGWELFVPDESLVIPRASATIVSYSDTELILLGGYST